MTHAKIIGALIAALALVGCGSDGPEDVVESFSKAYAKRDLKTACDYYDQQGSGGVTEALMEAAGDDPQANAKLERVLGSVRDENGVCPANLSLVYDANPEAARRLPDADVIDTDEDGENATVRTSTGTWELHEVDGEWKIGKLDPVLPDELNIR